MNHSTQSNIVKHPSATAPYKDLRSAHRMACIADIAAVCKMATPAAIQEKDIDTRFFRTYALQLAYIRHQNTLALGVPFSRAADYPRALAEYKDTGEFQNRCKAIAESRPVVEPTKDQLRAMVRWAVLEDTGGAVLQAINFVSRYAGAHFLAKFTTAAGVTGLLAEESGVIRLPTGVELHNKINTALIAHGLAPEPDIIPPPNSVKRPAGPPKLRIV